MNKNFLLGKVFRVEPAKGKCTRDLIAADGINYVAAKKTNNGVANRCSYIDADKQGIISDGNCVVFVQLGDGSAGYTTYQPEPFIGMNGKISCGYIDGILNEKIGMYLVAVLDKNKQLFSYSASWTGDRLRNTVMSLPVKMDDFGHPVIDAECKYHDDGYIPDWQYMQERIAELEQERIAELEQERIAELEHYLIATGLNDYELTEKDKEILAEKLTDGGALQNSESGNGCWKEAREFKVKNIFDVVTPTKRFNANSVVITENEGHPYVVRCSTNNGRRGFIKADEKYVNKGNVFSFGQDTATIFWQPDSFFTGDKIKILSPLFDCSEEIAQYIITCVKQTFSNFSWGSQSFKMSVIENSMLTLPIQTDEQNRPVKDEEKRFHPDGYVPDWQYMEDYIRAVEKVVVADVVRYKDSVIEGTKKIVEKGA